MKTPKTAHKRDTFATRAKIVENAVQIYAKVGFASTSIQSIADASGISQATVFYHFPDKESLIAEVLTTITSRNHESVSRSMEASDSAYQRIIKHGVGNLKWGLDFPEEGQILLLVYYLACFNPEFSERYQSMRTVARKRIEEHLLAGIRENIFELDSTAVESVAECLHDALVGGMVNIFTDSPRYTKATRHSALKRFERQWEKSVIQWTRYKIDGQPKKKGANQ